MGVIHKDGIQHCADMGWSGEDLEKAIKILGSLPPPKQEKVVVLDPVETCACGKKVPITSLEELNTGVFKIIGDVCKGCKDGKRLDRELARVVCSRCKRVITRIKPATDHTGFTFQAGKTYHLAECALCNPKIEQCPIIEKVIWNRTHKTK